MEFRHPPDARLDGSTSAASAGAGAAKPAGAAGAQGAAAEEVATCCACCGASGEGVSLSRCSGCRVVHYCEIVGCGTGCALFGGRCFELYCAHCELAVCGRVHFVRGQGGGCLCCGLATVQGSGMQPWPSSRHRIAGSGAHWAHVLLPCFAPGPPAAHALCANPSAHTPRRSRVPAQGLDASARHRVRPAAAAGGRAACGAARGQRCASAAAHCCAALARWQGGRHAALFAGCRCLAI